jgi:WhiB family redox-sensing transcriptional regulator
VSDWDDLAACKGEDVEVFFPDAGTGYNRARALCARCPVRVACLDDVLRYEAFVMTKGGRGRGLRHGMYGGATPEERARMRWIHDIKVAS